MPRFVTVKLRKIIKLECLLLRRVGRRVSDETETYSPGSSDLSAGCNSLWAAIPTSRAVPEI